MGLIAVAADKGAPGVTTAAVALAAVWPRPVLLAECDPAGGDLVYRLPAADGGRLDPRRGLLSLAVAARRGLPSAQVWEHVQKLRGGLDVLVGVTSAEQSVGLEPLWGPVGASLAALPEADVIADCGRIGADGPHYDLLARAQAIVLVTRASLGEMVRLRDRTAMAEAAVRRRGGPGGRVSVLVVADHRHFAAALAEVRQVLSRSAGPVEVIGGLAYEPRSAELLSGVWGGKLDRSLLIRTARQTAATLADRSPFPGETDSSASAALSAQAGLPATRPATLPAGYSPAEHPAAIAAAASPAATDASPPATDAVSAVPPVSAAPAVPIAPPASLGPPVSLGPAVPAAPAVPVAPEAALDLNGRGKHAGPGASLAESGGR